MFPDPILLVLVGAAFLAGMIGGFSGFGGALVFMPLASALVAPRMAAAAFLIMSSVLTVPLVLRALRLCRWHQILPVALAAMVTAPLGAWILAVADPLTLRWSLSILALGLLALLISGWRYTGEPHLAASLAVGGTSGVLSGVSQVSGPPIIAFWMSGPHPPDVLRANFLVYFTVMSLSTFVAYLWNGFFSGATVELILVLTPAYALALFVGARLFRFASAGFYRRLAYGAVAAAAITSMPVLDGILR